MLTVLYYYCLAWVPNLCHNGMNGSRRRYGLGDYSLLFGRGLPAPES